MRKFYVFALVVVGLTTGSALAEPTLGYFDSFGNLRALKFAPDRIAIVPIGDAQLLLSEIAWRPELNLVNGVTLHDDGLVEIPLNPAYQGFGQQVVERLDDEGLVLRRGAVFQGTNSSRPFFLDRGVIVKLRLPVETLPLRLLANTGLVPVEELGHSGTTFLCQANDAESALLGAQRAFRLENVAWALPDFIVPVELYLHPEDPLYDQQWHHQQASGAHINSEAAWDATKGSAQVVVAIIDTGLEEKHPDFEPIRIAKGYNVKNGTNDPSPLSSTIDAHGTCCAGEIGATINNGEGLVGVCPGCSLMGIKMMDGNATTSSISKGYKAFQYATDNGAWVMSNSWGIDQAQTDYVPMDPFYQAIQEATTQGRDGLGSVVLFASGNGDPYTGEGKKIGKDELGNMPEVMAVGGTDYQDEVVDYSNYGANLSVVAPTGTMDVQMPMILTTDTTGNKGFSREGSFWTPDWYGNDTDTDLPEPDNTGNYTQYFSGTSASTPIAAGVVALVFSANQELTGLQARRMVEQTADKLAGVTFDENGHHIQYGYGRVNAGRAVQAALMGVDNSGGAQCYGHINCESGNCVKSAPTEEMGICAFMDCNGVPDNQPCGDGSVCTKGDSCQGGSCVGTEIDCNDGNICTDDFCDPLAGCYHRPTDSCDDQNVCTDDGCNPGAGCYHTNNTSECDDGSVCTTVDQCSKGVCSGMSIDCDDHNPCTDDSCDPVSGCAHTPNNVGCDDEDICTQNDKCTDGTCQGTPLDCSTDNPCEVGECSQETGKCESKLAVDGTPCDDADSCTQGDKCQNGACLPGNDTCDDSSGCGFSTQHTPALSILGLLIGIMLARRRR